ncbi:MFS transporter [Arthrobacter gengyunqii]|uniref:MFS transporter n=1 Tax=Arthrobacter gengyunqii TaxID=2886940 RepID=A0A9X1M531_9MICC|nr:MFS transporter [Arthrobacter gengyunqii]MCC3270960.1 MFS transporter [Arthrobacter gengyunqii]UOY96549.1 MFS transporter [Arthrobacter gengyunqii]
MSAKTGAGGSGNALRRERSALLAAGLTYGPAELIDFLIPLWAGIALGASASQVGLLIAAELLVSVLVRPLAGRLADSRERRTLAGFGAVVYGLSCFGYALADSLPLAFAAAIVGGAGGAVLWVSLRAIVSERLSVDSGVFARFMSVQSTGSWIAFVAGLMLLGQTNLFAPVLAGCGAACMAGAVALFASPPRHAGLPDARATAGGAADAATSQTGTGSRAVARLVRPMLLTSAITTVAEAAVSILLLLHLQRGIGLGVIEAAFVFLPGAIAMMVLPPVLHKAVLRIGRRRAVMAASVFSAVFAVSLAWVDSPVLISVLWILSGVAFAVLMPIEQAVVAEAAPNNVGTAMGVYTAVGLLSAAAGAIAAGVLYEFSSWQAACLVSGALILSGAVLGPWAIGKLGVADVPVEESPVIQG